MNFCYSSKNRISQIRKVFLSAVIGMIIALTAGICLPLHARTTTPVQIETQNKYTTVQAEIALTPEQQALGLMYRTDLPENNGMIFLFDAPKIVTMWMKNTYIPLDMIFFNSDGIITHIHKNAIPHNETIISSQTPAVGVLEVNAGFAQKHGIGIGNKLIYNQLNQE